MAKATDKQFVPVFVGSTYQDLQEYRASVREAIHRLEAIVRGMEYFGAKPGSPKDECLKVVQSCKVYVGIFAMRYGSIDEETEKSLTHLEYEEACRLKLPILIYLIDEENQPILPKFVEVGENAEKLKALKVELKRKHIVNFFSTPEDLANRISQDLPTILGENISLSNAEQAAFFAEYGSQIEQILHKGFGGIDNRLKRLEFLHDCSKPLMGATAILTLRQECTVEDLGHFRFMVEVFNMHEDAPYPGLWIAGRDAYPERHSQGKSGKYIGVQSLAWSRNPDEEIQNTQFSMFSISTNQLDAGAHLHKRGPYRTLKDLDGRRMSIYVTKPLFDLTAGIYFIANDYIIAGADAEYFIPLDVSPLMVWPEPLSEVEKQVPWVVVTLKIVDPPEWMNPELARTGWNLEFSTYTPQKYAAQ